MTALTAWLASLPWQLVVGTAAAVIAVVAAFLGFRWLFPPPSEIARRLEGTTASAEPLDRVEEKQDKALPSVLRPLAWIVRPSKAEELSRLRQKLVHAGLRGPRAMEGFLIA